MRAKQNILDHHQELGVGATSHILRNAIELEVQIDIRDALIALTKAVEEVGGVLDMKRF